MERRGEEDDTVESQARGSEASGELVDLEEEGNLNSLWKI